MNQIPAPRPGPGQAPPGRGRPAGGVRRAAPDPRMTGDPEPRSRAHVQEGADREPGRDRAARPPRLQGDGHPDGGDPFDRRLERHARPHGRRERLHRPAAGEPELPVDAEHHRRLRDHRRRGDPSGLRLPLRERHLRRRGQGPRPGLHRPDRRAHPADGRQDHRQGDDAEARRPLRARLGRRGADARRGAEGRQGARLPGDRQGDRRRRRPRHEARPHRRRHGDRLRDRALRGQGRLRQRRGLPREVPRPAAAHRGAGLRRRQGRRRAPRRARLLAAAPAPEGVRGGAVAGDRHPHPAPDRPDLRRGGGEDRLRRRRDHRVPLRERRVLLHRDEHPAAGRASGHRGDLRRRPGAGADPGRRRREDVLHPGRPRADRATPSSAGSTPSGCRASSRARAGSRPTTPPGASASAWTAPSTAATPSRPTTTA